MLKRTFSRLLKKSPPPGAGPGLFLLPFCLVLATAGGAALRCTTEEDSELSPTEANWRILAAYAAKDIQCGQIHQVTVPIFADASAESVDLCVFDILAQSCTTWGGTENLPAACLAIQIHL
jgi:hypothetical protein